MNNLISLIMPTYNRDFIIELAILSIIHQKEHGWNIELLIGDDGNDNTEESINKIQNVNPKLEIRYFKMNRISISDKVNYLIRKSNGEYYGLIGSDDIQSPYKISSFEKALKQNPTAEVFGQRAFIYHDIILGNSNLWTQNKKMTFFKAGSFVIISRKLFNKVDGYPKGLWKRVDGTFYKKIAPLKPEICDVSKIDDRVIKTSIALQHIDNIWDRKAKGLHKNKPKQLANFYAEPIKITLGSTIPAFFDKYNDVKNNLIQMIKHNYCIDDKKNVSAETMKKLNILIVVSLSMHKQNGASNIRPAKIIEAFKQTTHNIDIIESPTRKTQRLNIIKNILKNVFLKKKYDICYFEPSSYPIQKMEKQLIKWLKIRETWISYFHRDMYWRYEIGADLKSNRKFEKHKAKQECNLQFLENNIDLLFTPTELYAEKLNSILKTVALPPAGNLNKIEYSPEKRKGVIYVGGVSERYGTKLLLQSFEEINKKCNIPLIIVCRENSELFKNYLNNSWLTIEHLDNSQIEKLYSKHKFGIIPINKMPYHEFAMPFKLLEYASYGLPIAVSDNYEQVKLVEKNQIGINIGESVESFTENIIKLYENTKLLNKYHNNSTKFIKHNGLWRHRVATIIKQYRGRNEK